MSIELHTPGTMAVRGTGSMAVYASGHRRVADCNVFEVPYPECQANARRIAAALNATRDIPTGALEACGRGGMPATRLGLLGSAVDVVGVKLCSQSSLVDAIEMLAVAEQEVRELTPSVADSLLADGDSPAAPLVTVGSDDDDDRHL